MPCCIFYCDCLQALLALWCNSWSADGVAAAAATAPQAAHLKAVSEKQPAMLPSQHTDSMRMRQAQQGSLSDTEQPTQQQQAEEQLDTAAEQQQQQSGAVTSVGSELQEKVDIVKMGDAVAGLLSKMPATVTASESDTAETASVEATPAEATTAEAPQAAAPVPEDAPNAADAAEQEASPAAASQTSSVTSSPDTAAATAAAADAAASIATTTAAPTAPASDAAALVAMATAAPAAAAAAPPEDAAVLEVAAAPAAYATEGSEMVSFKVSQGPLPSQVISVSESLAKVVPPSKKARNAAAHLGATAAAGLTALAAALVFAL
jgi:hypothetical protein